MARPGKKAAAKKPPAQKTVWTVTDPAEIARRLATFRCLGCNARGMNHPMYMNQETGFPAQYCTDCSERNRAAQPPGPQGARRAHREAGIANLDNLTGRNE